MLARSQFGATATRTRSEERARAFGGYAGALFMMVVGSLFLSLNIAPTEEVIEIAYTMTPWHALATVGADRRGDARLRLRPRRLSSDDMPWWGDLLRFTLVGYVLALAICLFTLWSFGRSTASASGRLLMTLVVLAFPAGLGAAAARLLL